VLVAPALLAVLATGALAASPPVVMSVSPDAGPLDGGGTVTITGANFTTVSAVDFGTAAGKGLTVVSEHEITVTPPFGSGVVDLTVHAAAGTSALTPADEFHYELSSGSLSWGRDSSGELGIGEAGSRVATLPVEVKNLSEATQLSAGNGNSLALLADGQVAAWGNGTGGQLGDGTKASKPAPVRVCAVGVSACAGGPYLEGVVQVSDSGTHSLALLDDGTVVAWGLNVEGELGDGNTTESSVPVHVCTVVEVPCQPQNYLGGVKAVSAGARFSLALLDNGTAVAWGSNEVLQLGNGHPTEKCGKKSCALRPIPVTELTGAVAISTGSEQSFATLENGEVLAWGDNHTGQLGIGQEGEKLRPPTAVCAVGEVAPCAEHLHVATVVGTAGGGAALLGDGEVASWGGSQHDTPMLRSGVSGVRELAGSAATSDLLMLLEDGRLLENGANVCSPYATGGCAEGPDLSVAGPVSLFAIGNDFGLATITPSHAPVLERVAPATGGLAGGTPVRLSGDLLGEVTAVHFGAAQATEVQVISAHEVLAVTPPGADNATVTVSGPEGTSAVLRPGDVFAYRGVPEFGRCEKASKHTGLFDGGCKAQEASGTSEWIPWPPVDPGLTVTAGTVTFETTGHIVITCGSASGSGEITGPQSTSQSLVLSGCHASGLPGVASECQNRGAGSGEIATEALTGRIALIEAKGSDVGLDLAGASGTIASFECGGTPVVLSGSVIVAVRPNKMASTQALKYKARKGVQAVESLKGEANDVLETSAGGPSEQTGLNGTVTLATAEPLEIKGE
jgi:hypothetical protein